jgi:SAM-dependent methyltransferase
MTEVHEVAARGFGAEAAAYDRARPSYPPDAIAWLTDKLGIGPGRQVIDLAAGTGKLTEPLAHTGAELVAVEPVTSMRDRLHERLPNVPVLAGVAEALPLADKSVDVVLVAQAFHWFDARRAIDEIARVVRPGGCLGLIWNARDRSLEWVDQVWSVVDRVERHAPWRDARDDGEPARSERYLVGPRDSNWSSWIEAAFFHVHHASHEDVVERIRSVSHVAVLPPAHKDRVLSEIRAILAEHPQTRHTDTVGIPYRVDVMYAKRLG